MPSVTIIVPTRDRAGLVERTIDSVLAQRHPDLELLVIDDGSADDTPAVLERYAERHPTRFRWARHDNVGQARTLNRGFEMARGDLVGYLSSDDLLLPGAVDTLAGALDGEPDAVLSYPAYRVIDGAGETVATMTPPEYSRAESVRLQDTIVGPGALFRRSVVERVGGWDPGYGYLADFEFWLRVAKLGQFRRVPQALACWRRHDDAISVVGRGPEMARERLRLLDHVYSGEVPPDLEAVRGEAYRNAHILAALVIAPGANTAGERYFLSDTHARAVSSEAGPAAPEAKIADMRSRLAEQQRIIQELTESATALRRELVGRKPILGVASRLTWTRMRTLARRRLWRGSKWAA